MKRELLPDNERPGHTRKITLSGVDFYCHTGEYPDGRLGEIAITVGKEGDTLRGMARALSQVFSIGLQHGVPLSEYTNSLRYMQFEPGGFDDAGHYIGSIADFLARWLDERYGDNDDKKNQKQ